MGKKMVSVLTACMLLVVMLAGSAFAAEADVAKADAPQAGGTLVVYAAMNEDMINGMFPAFEQATGIKVELISGGSSEMLKRIQAEQANPYCDIMIGGGNTVYMPYIDLFEAYETSNIDAIIEGHTSREYQNKLTPYSLESGIMMWNTNLVGDIEPKGLADFLRPEFRGKIAFADPAASGSSAGFLANWAYLMSGKVDYLDDAGWEFITSFADQLEGKLSPSSSASHKAVADGEKTIVMTYEGAVWNYLRNGAPIAACYPEEGIVFDDCMMGIVKDCANMENAKLFIDFVTSAEFQHVQANELFNRPIRSDTTLPDIMTPFSEINTYQDDFMKRTEAIPAVLERFNDIMADLQS